MPPSSSFCRTAGRSRWRRWGSSLLWFVPVLLLLNGASLLRPYYYGDRDANSTATTTGTTAAAGWIRTSSSSGGSSTRPQQPHSRPQQRRDPPKPASSSPKNHEGEEEEEEEDAPYRVVVDPTGTRRRTTVSLERWDFRYYATRGDEESGRDKKDWAGAVRVPHDWAIAGPFDASIDSQTVRVIEDGDQQPRKQTGRTGSLPHVGIGWYRTRISVELPKRQPQEHEPQAYYYVEFDGAMSRAQVYWNDALVGEWPYGYASFGFEIPGRLVRTNEGRATAAANVLSVRLENEEQASRWYPGAGIYRHARLLVHTGPVHIPQWGTYVTTPYLRQEMERPRHPQRIGTVRIETKIDIKDYDAMKKVASEKQQGRRWMLEHRIYKVNEYGEPVASVTESIHDDLLLLEKSSSPDRRVTRTTEVAVPAPELWSPEHPHLYAVRTILYTTTAGTPRAGDDGDAGGGDRARRTVWDAYETKFGFRYFEFTLGDGFYWNGRRVPLRGVCMHHDLGPLGAAINLSAMKHRLRLLQQMGCNAIRTSHNPPAPELLDLTDAMGFFVINEIFDEWKDGKMIHGYSTLWDEWASKDVIAWIRRDRNHPSVIAWSIGNEIREQAHYQNATSHEGLERCQFLSNLCHEHDPTRPTTAGFNDLFGAMRSGLAGQCVDVIGWNYKPQNYSEIHRQHPRWKMYGSETASTVSSRGEYYFPAIERVLTPEVARDRSPDYHCSSYDLEYPSWASSPDREFAAQDDPELRFLAGEFVWTGFDYLGEPTPYNTEWPSRSSYFGILDLAGIPKDRYYLYQSRWKKGGANGTDATTPILHVLPHWNWEDSMVGQNISVHAYTNLEVGELFVNGHSFGIRRKDPSQLYTTYRLVWDGVPYQPGEVKVVAYEGTETRRPVQETVVRTAGQPAKLLLEPDRAVLAADGKELVFVTVTVLDANGVPCPRADNYIAFTVRGEGTFRAVGNGDPTSLESFVEPHRKAFNGKCMVIAQSTTTTGRFVVRAESENLRPAEVVIQTTRETT